MIEASLAIFLCAVYVWGIDAVSRHRKLISSALWGIFINQICVWRFGGWILGVSCALVLLVLPETHGKFLKVAK